MRQVSYETSVCMVLVHVLGGHPSNIKKEHNRLVNLVSKKDHQNDYFKNFLIFNLVHTHTHTLIMLVLHIPKFCISSPSHPASFRRCRRLNMILIFCKISLCGNAYMPTSWVRSCNVYAHIDIECWSMLHCILELPEPREILVL